jgi:hypothetical protein
MSSCRPVARQESTSVAPRADFARQPPPAHSEGHANHVAYELQSFSASACNCGSGLKFAAMSPDLRRHRCASLLTRSESAEAGGTAPFVHSDVGLNGVPAQA